MSLPATFAPAALPTVLGPLAGLLLSAAADLPAARHAATQMLAAYHPQNEEELRVAGDIITFGLHALQALSQAADPDRTLNQILRLRGSAVSLSRESHKAQRKLDRLQRDRRAGIDPQPAEASAAQPTTDPVQPPISPIGAADNAVEPADNNAAHTPTQDYRQRRAAKRLAKQAMKHLAKRAHRPSNGTDAATMAAKIAANLRANRGDAVTAKIDATVSHSMPTAAIPAEAAAQAAPPA